MLIKKTIIGFFVATACSGAVLAAEPQFNAVDEAPPASVLERYTGPYTLVEPNQRCEGGGFVPSH